MWANCSQSSPAVELRDLQCDSLLLAEQCWRWFCHWHSVVVYFNIKVDYILEGSNNRGTQLWGHFIFSTKLHQMTFVTVNKSGKPPNNSSLLKTISDHSLAVQLQCREYQSVDGTSVYTLIEVLEQQQMDCWGDAHQGRRKYISWHMNKTCQLIMNESNETKSVSPQSPMVASCKLKWLLKY